MSATKPVVTNMRLNARNAKPKRGPQARLVDVAAIEKAATLRRAQERLARIEDMRDAQRLAEAGMAQRDIADLLHTTQPRVHRMLRAMEGRESEAVTPEEIILRATVGDGSRAELVKRLSAVTYTLRQYAPAPFGGAISGSWDDVKHAFVSGLLTKREFERVRAAVKPPSV